MKLLLLLMMLLALAAPPVAVAQVNDVRLIERSLRGAAVGVIYTLETSDQPSVKTTKGRIVTITSVQDEQGRWRTTLTALVACGGDLVVTVGTATSTLERLRCALLPTVPR